jgi:DegV family protein with EDD domain
MGTDRVAVVTDSTAYLPPGAAAGLGVRVVPLRVSIGDRELVDGPNLPAATVTAALRDRIPVTTSRPSPAEFAAAFRQCLDAGATHVVSVHLAAALSGTWESAVLAAQDFGYGVVRVVDSRSTAAALGFAVRAAAERAVDGASAAQVQGAATDVVDRTRTLFYVDTIEYLRRGGRVGTASALVATSLSVKPLLQMVEGRIVPLEKVRTSAKAIARLVQLTAQAAGHDRVDLAVHHLAAPDRADAVSQQVRAALPDVGESIVAEVGPVIGAHLGPGVIGTVVVRR